MCHIGQSGIGGGQALLQKTFILFIGINTVGNKILFVKLGVTVI